jgi:antitoxin PrlF
MPPAIATVTSKGQITVPARMRERLGLRPGSKLVFDEQPNGDFVVRKKTGDIRELRGILKAPPDFALTVEEMDDAIAAAVAERLDRSR